MKTNLHADPGSPKYSHLVENEIQLFEYLDGQASAEEAARVRAHLAHCSECHQLQLQWQLLDAQLAAGLELPALSSNFANRLLAQIGSQPLPSLAPLDLHLKRMRLETEWRGHWIHDRKSFLRSSLPLLLDYIGYAVAMAMAAYCLFALLNHSLRSLVSAPPTPMSQVVLPIACGLSAVLLFLTLGFTAKHCLWRWFAKL